MNNTELNNLTVNKKPQRFFEKQLDLDIDHLKDFLLEQYKRIENGEIVKGFNSGEAFKESNSITTMQWNRYNAFQFYDTNIFKLVKAIKDMTLEACEYYDLSFIDEEFMAQAWFNVNYAKKGKLDWHEHGGNGAPYFHGYYCISAEPSITYYKINDELIENHNKNNRAILSETNHPHAMADWDWDGPRITLAYDVVPLRFIPKGKDWEQHWIPLV